MFYVLGVMRSTAGFNSRAVWTNAEILQSIRDVSVLGKKKKEKSKVHLFSPTAALVV